MDQSLNDLSRNSSEFKEKKLKKIWESQKPALITPSKKTNSMSFNKKQSSADGLTIEESDRKKRNQSLAGVNFSAAPNTAKKRKQSQPSQYVSSRAKTPLMEATKK